MRVGHQKDFGVMRALEPSAHPPFSREGLEMELMMDHVSVMKPL